jgi:2Fe-2S ferredoxin
LVAARVRGHASDGIEEALLEVEATITVTPAGIELSARPGETVMAAAVRLGYRWPTVCNGDGTCSVCWVEVTDGADGLGPLTGLERTWLDGFLARHLCAGPARLACQATVHGPVVVRKKGVRPAAS